MLRWPALVSSIVCFILCKGFHVELSGQVYRLKHALAELGLLILKSN